MNRFKTFALLALTLALLTGCQKSEEETPPIRPVLTLKLEPTILAGSRFAGTVQPRIQAQLGARASGRLVARNVGIGDLVKKDELLATLDLTTFELAVRSAKAELSSAEATYANAVDTEQRQRALLESNTSAQATVESAEQARKIGFCVIDPCPHVALQGGRATVIYPDHGRVRRRGHCDRRGSRPGGFHRRGHYHRGPPG